MTKEQKDKILKALAEERNHYVRECNNRITAEQGKITGADYMIQKFLDVLMTEVEPQERSDNEIKVGDEVYLVDRYNPRVITCITKINDTNHPLAIQFTKNGKSIVDDVTKLHKTGRHFDQIEEVLKALSLINEEKEEERKFFDNYEYYMSFINEEKEEERKFFDNYEYYMSLIKENFEPVENKPGYVWVSKNFQIIISTETLAKLLVELVQAIEKELEDAGGIR